MRKAAKQIILCSALLFLCCVICRNTFFDHLNIYLPLREPGLQEIRITAENPETVRIGEPDEHTWYVWVPVYPESAGDTDLFFDTGTGSPAVNHWIRVDRFNTVYDMNNGNFTGDTAVLAAVTMFWLMVSAIMLWHFFQAKGAAFYDYGTIYYSGFSLFALASGLVMLNVTVSHTANPEAYSMYSAYSAISGASMLYMILSAPLMLLFAAAMAVSNIALLRHERPRIRNALGLLVSVALIIGEAVGLYLYFFRNFSGSELEGRIDSALQNTFATVFIYFQCMLTGAVICGITAARRRPAFNKDFIIILGCWVRPDGSLPPLLRSRADKALDFWRKQKEETGKEAVFIPSGGQGSNEPMPEGEAVRQYLLAQGIEDRLIMPETKSVNTLQNMANSRDIIRGTAPDGKTAFSTSSYHVFRSGIWARQTGLSAEGMGSRTKWWFWPNAFMRETAGLLQKRWKQELLFLLMLIVFFGTLSMIL